MVFNSHFHVAVFVAISLLVALPLVLLRGWDCGSPRQGNPSSSPPSVAISDLLSATLQDSSATVLVLNSTSTLVKWFASMVTTHRDFQSRALPHSGKRRRRRFVRYEASPFEQEWMSHIAEWQSDDPKWTVPCQHLQKRMEWVDRWLKAIEQRRANQSVELSMDVFSRLVFVEEEEQSGSESSATKRTEVVQHIEPLVSHLRHPYHICIAEDPYFFNKGYLVFPKIGEIAQGARKFFFDLGASTYHEGIGGPSQQWFLEEYAQYGIYFDRFLAWEATPISQNILWRNTPLKMKTIISYFNILSSADPNSDDNVLLYILSLCRPEDYCAIKIDIDNNPVESAIIDQILNTTAVHPLIDDLFWEHHVRQNPIMTRGWGYSPVAGTTAQSYRVFTALRKSGIAGQAYCYGLPLILSWLPPPSDHRPFLVNLGHFGG